MIALRRRRRDRRRARARPRRGSDPDVAVPRRRATTGDADVRLVSGVSPARIGTSCCRSVARWTRTPASCTTCKTQTMLLVVLVTAAAAALGWLIARTVSGPLARLTRAATDVQDPAASTSRSRSAATTRSGASARRSTGCSARSPRPRRPAPARRGRRPRAAHAADERAHEPRRAAPPPRPRRRDPRQDHRRPPRRDRGARRPRRGGRGPGPRARPTARRPNPSTSARWPRVVAGRAERRHGRAVIVVADDSVVEAPPPALERAISNLVDNAAKFDQRVGPIEIEVAAGRLVVHDRGPGITEADAGAHLRSLLPRRGRSRAARVGPRAVDRPRRRRALRRTGRGAPRPGGGATVGFRLPLRPRPRESPRREPLAGRSVRPADPAPGPGLTPPDAGVTRAELGGAAASPVAGVDAGQVDGGCGPRRPRPRTAGARRPPHLGVQPAGRSDEDRRRPS